MVGYLLKVKKNYFNGKKESKKEEIISSPPHQPLMRGFNFNIEKFLKILYKNFCKLLPIFEEKKLLRAQKN